MNINLQKSTFITGEIVLIFLTCSVIYLANGETISSGDTVPNTLLAFNLFENHTFHLDAFRASYFVDRGVFYAFAEGNNGHLSSTYPIGSAIVTFPFYVIFYIYLKLIYSYLSVPLDITSENFEVYRVFFEKFAATITTAISIVIFYLSSRLKFNRGISLVSTFIFAFATNTWVTSSQGLWQHGISNLALICTIFCLLKANRTSKGSQKIWLILAGVACGLLPAIRPTSTLFTIAAIVYSVFTYRFQSIFLFFGLVSALPSLAWNLYYFGNLTGGYSKMFPESPYLFTWDNFKTAFLGTLISPSRGLLVFSPIVLFSLPGAYKVFKFRFGKDEKLIGCITIASIILIISYFFYKVWWAGHSYGPRFMTDIMPLACYLINYFSEVRLVNLGDRKKNFSIFVLFVLAIAYSTFTQFVGFLGANPWNPNPLNIDSLQNQYRLWDIRDNPIQRSTNTLLHKNLIILPTDNAVYAQGLSGIIKKVIDEKNQPINSLISVGLGTEKFLKAYLENTGRYRWFGYESAIEKGEVRVRGRFFNTDNQQVKEVRLYVSGTPKQHETTNAIGSISFPDEPGTYKLIFDLVAEGVAEFPKNNGLDQSHVFTVLVEDNRQFAQEIQILEPFKFGKLGETVKIPLMVKNTSNFVWKKAGTNPVNLAYHWLDNNGKIIIFDGERTPLPGSLPVQGLVQLNATIKLPNQPGKYTIVLSMVKEGVAWFNDKNVKALEIPIEVISR
ncbi:glycosyltransferase family 39 protein [Pelatocladus sp. BLCC-F211]|uniref:glycosyltransferase family 39 protein n=1 Tax=Pelatocladus sp. BLCC-F211 TaxID=3342752 RepID=UPI0035B72A4B